MCYYAVIDRRACPGISSSLRLLFDNIGLPITSKISPSGEISSGVVDDNGKWDVIMEFWGGGIARVLALVPRVLVAARARDMRNVGALDILRLL